MSYNSTRLREGQDAEIIALESRAWSVKLGVGLPLQLPNT